MTTTVKKPNSAKLSAVTPSAPHRKDYQPDHSKTGEEISKSSLDAFPSIRSVRIADNTYRRDLTAPQAPQATTIDLRDLKREELRYRVRDLAGTALISILGTALVFVIIWLLWFAFGA